MKEKETIIEINDSEILTASLVRFCLLIFSSFIRNYEKTNTRVPFQFDSSPIAIV